MEYFNSPEKEYDFDLENRKQKIKGYIVLTMFLLVTIALFYGVARGTDYINKQVYKIMGVEK